MSNAKNAPATSKTEMNKSSGATMKTTRSGKTRAVSRERPGAETRQKRASNVAARTSANRSASSKARSGEEKGLVDLLEHALKDMYYAERKIYRSLPKMIKAADNDALVEALTSHREETQGHIETLEAVFDAMGMRAKGEKCDAIDGILTEAESILEDFGGTLAGDAAIIFSARAVEHYEICRYSAMVGFADALGLDDVQGKLKAVLDQENAAEAKMMDLAEGSINEAASEYDDQTDHDLAGQKRAKDDGHSDSGKVSEMAK